MSRPDINPKKFPIGSVVYWMEFNNLGSKCDYEVKFGTVLEHYAGEVCVQLYDICNNQLIDGIPIQKLVTPTKWHKLPKGWSYDTELFELTFKPCSLKMESIDNSDGILKAIESGCLVPVQDKDYSIIDTEIDSRKGWRLIRRYNYNDCHPSYKCIRFTDVYGTVNEVCERISEHQAQLQKIADMSEYDWAVREIDETLDRWAAIYSVPDDTKQKYRDWILALDNIEDVETKVWNGAVQWKYSKNKRWMNIVL